MTNTDRTTVHLNRKCRSIIDNATKIDPKWSLSAWFRERLYELDKTMKKTNPDFLKREFEKKQKEKELLDSSYDTELKRLSEEIIESEQRKQLEDQKIQDRLNTQYEGPYFREYGKVTLKSDLKKKEEADAKNSER